MSREETSPLGANDQVNPVADNSAATSKSEARNSGSTPCSPDWESFKAGTRHLNTVEKLPEMFGPDGGFKRSELVLATHTNGRKEELYCGQNWNEDEPWWYVPLPDENGFPNRLATFGIVSWEPLSEGVLVG